MADTETKAFIMTVTFLGVLVVLFAWIPPQFYTSGDSRQVGYPSSLFEGIDIYSFAESRTIQLNESGGHDWWVDSTYYVEDIDIGNWDLDLYYKKGNQSNLRLQVVHIWYDWIIFPNDDTLSWYDRSGVQIVAGGSALLSSAFLSVGQIETNHYGENSRWRASCSHTTLHVTFAYNTTLYSSYTQAWNQGELYAFFGINFDDINTSYNAWDLIARLMFFDLPDIQTNVNILLAIPVYATITVTIFLMIIKVIPLIKGS